MQNELEVGRTEDMGIETPHFRFGIRLTAEQVKSIKGMEISIFKIQGESLFDIRDGNGISTGDRMLYVVFK